MNKESYIFTKEHYATIKNDKLEGGVPMAYYKVKKGS